MAARQEAHTQERQLYDLNKNEVDKKAQALAAYIPNIVGDDVKSWVKKVRAILTCRGVPLHDPSITNTYRPLIFKHLPYQLLERLINVNTLNEIFDVIERYQLNVTGYLNAPNLVKTTNKPPSEIYHELVSEYNIKLHHPNSALVESMAWLTLKTHGQPFIKSQAITMMIDDAPTARQLEALDEIWLERGNATQQSTSICAINTVPQKGKMAKKAKNGKNGKSGQFGGNKDFKKNTTDRPQSSSSGANPPQKSRGNADFEARKDKRVCWYHWKYELKAQKCNKAEFPNCPFELHPNG